MGQKVHPYSFRLGFTKPWLSRWYARHGAYADFLHEDIQIRRHLKKQLKTAAVARIEIERAANRVRVSIHTAKPGIIIGRRGADIDRLREELQKFTKREIYVDIKEVKNPAIEAQLVAENIAFQLEKQIAFRRAMKRALQMAMSSGAKGVRIKCAGRLGGAEMSRREGYREGSIPLHTLRADIDYGFAEALTTYGLIGIKVWVHKGDALLSGEKQGSDAASSQHPRNFKSTPPASPLLAVAPAAAVEPANRSS
ncbi:MAG: 30S ribosomal protein S3 [Candidatus Omnitrophica bacterium]|nr:30S ribosomal protein S3 [Candidatus Omnitrophota bacterium]